MAKIEFVKTDSLHLAYEDSGPPKGIPVLLAHGWPDSPRTWDAVLPTLHAAGYRTLVPYLRGFAPTEFRKHLLGRNPKRSGQPVAFAQDMVDLADRLKIKQFHFVGHDWGARAGYALSAIFPARLLSLTVLSVQFAPGPLGPPTLSQSQAFWYQWFLCTDPGAKAFTRDPLALAHRMWETWSPGRWFTEGDFSAASKSWATEDFLHVTLHAYRSRWGHAEFDAKYDVLQDRYHGTLSLPTPTLLIQGLDDRCILAESTDGMGRFFSGGYRRALLDDVGHFPSREAPEETARLILEHMQTVRESA